MIITALLNLATLCTYDVHVLLFNEAVFMNSASHYWRLITMCFSMAIIQDPIWIFHMTQALSCDIGQYLFCNSLRFTLQPHANTTWDTVQLLLLILFMY